MKIPLISFTCLVFILLLFAPRAPADDILGPDLSTFAVLGGTPVVSFAAGNDTITGNVGVSPAASITIASPLTFTLTGTQHAGDATAMAAQAGLTNALTVLGGLASVGTAQSNLNAVSLNPGVYNIGAADLTGTLTLTNTLGVTNPSWVFIGSSLTSSGVVMFAPGLNASNAGVYWVALAGQAAQVEMEAAVALPSRNPPRSLCSWLHCFHLGFSRSGSCRQIARRRNGNWKLFGLCSCASPQIILREIGHRKP
jgi:hypothetical protein